MQKIVTVKGAVTETATSWTPDFRLDTGALKAQVDFQINSGIKALFCMGLNFELDEEVEFVKLLVKHTAGRVPVFANVGEKSTALALKRVKQYEDAGADIIFLTQPWGGISPREQKRHLATLIESTDHPVGILNEPRQGYVMPPEVIADLANEYDHFVYYKNGTKDLVHLQTIMNLSRNPNLTYLEGSDGTILASMAVGGHGVISAISIVFPKLIVDLCDSILAGEWEKARELNRKVLMIRCIIKKISGSTVNYLADLLGVFPGGSPKPPRLPFTEEDQEYLKRELSKLDFIKLKS